MKPRNCAPKVLLLAVFAFQSGLTQTNKVAWSTFSSGYGSPTSNLSRVASVVGQSPMGIAQSSTSRVTSGFLAGANWGEVVTDILSVYAGDANNDGTVDVRDVLPIGRFFGISGATRQSGSLSWGQQYVHSWTLREASYADCDGNGIVQGIDVNGIIQNWHLTQGSFDEPTVDRVAVCRQMLEEIDQQPASAAMKEIRSAIVSYMSNTLGVSFAFALQQNYPNPFNPTTTIRFTIPEDIPQTRLMIFNILGQCIWEAELTDLHPGDHELKWLGENSQGSTVASGVYFYRILAGRYTAVNRMMVLK